MMNSDIEIVEYENLRINPLEQTVYYGKKEIIFTNREFQVLYLRLKYKGQVFSKRQIYDQVTEDIERINYHTIEITISRIRKKIEKCSGKKGFHCYDPRKGI